MANLERLELWSDVQAAGGGRLAVFGNLLELAEQVGLNGEHTLTLATAFDNPAVITMGLPGGETNFEGNKVLRLVLSDHSWTEHRIAEPGRQNQNGQRTRRLVAHSIMADLGQRGSIMRYMGKGKWIGTFDMLGLTPREHWDQFLYPALVEGGQPWWTLLLVLPAAVANRPVDLVYDRDTPLSALHKLSTALGGMELAHTPGATTHLVTIQPRIGATAAPIMVRVRRNLTNVGVSENHTDQATRIFAYGAAHDDVRPSLADAEWSFAGSPVVTAHPTDPLMELVTFPLTDPAGGPGPTQFAGQWVPGYALKWLTFPLILVIYATNPVLQTVTVLNRIDDFVPTAGHRAKIVRVTGLPLPYDPNAGEDAPFVDHPTMRDRYGVRVGHLERSDIPATNNLLLNPIMRQWEVTSPLPVGWRRSIPFPAAQVQRTTVPGEWDTAGVAMKASMTDGGQHTINTPTSLLPYDMRGFISFFVRLKVLVGVASVRLVLVGTAIDTTNGLNTPTGIVVVVPDNIPNMPDVLTTQRNVWQDIGVAAAVDMSDMPAQFIITHAEVHLEILPAFGTTECTVCIDSVQLTLTSDQRPMLEGNGGTRLFQAAHEHLARYADPATTITVDLLDLARLDPVRFLYDRFILGGDVRVVDPETDIDVATRIIGWNRDLLRAANTSLHISNERADLTSILAIRPSSARHRQGAA